jgi:HAMP domain-containing protein
MAILVGLVVVIGAALFLVAWRHNARRQPSAG